MDYRWTTDVVPIIADPYISRCSGMYLLHSVKFGSGSGENNVLPNVPDELQKSYRRATDSPEWLPNIYRTSTEFNRTCRTLVGPKKSGENFAAARKFLPGLFRLF